LTTVKQAGALKDRHSLNKRYTKAKLSTRKSKDVPCDQTKNENNDNRMERSYEIGDLVEVYSSTHRSSSKPVTIGIVTFNEILCREYLPGMITKVLESEGKVCISFDQEYFEKRFMLGTDLCYVPPLSWQEAPSRKIRKDTPSKEIKDKCIWKVF